MSRQFLLKSLLVSFLATIVFFSCKKNNTTDPDPKLEEPNNTVSTLVFGVVTDENNKPLSGAVININNQDVLTDNNGNFMSKGLTLKQRTVLKANYNGYFQSIHLLELDGKKTHNVQVKLQKKVSVANFNASSGTTANIGSSGASVVFPSNSYVNAKTNQPYTGNIKVYARFANIDSPNFLETVPATMRATDANGTVSRLETFGMMEVLMEDESGNTLQLSNGRAILKMPVAGSQSTTAPNSIPLWSLDENTATWKQEGVATKQGGLYVGEVSHFTWWNCDIAQPVSQRAAIKGKTVMTINGNVTPVSGVYVYSTLGGGGNTDTDGTFGYNSVAAVTSGTPLTISFKKYDNCQTAVVTVNIPALSVGEVYDMGNIDVSALFQNAVVVSGTVNLCNNTPAGEFAHIKVYDANNNYVLGTFTNVSSQFSFVSCGLPAKIIISNISGEEQTITNLVSGNLGTITLNCSNANNDNEYFINGDGFNNLKVVYTDANLPVVSDSSAVYFLGTYTPPMYSNHVFSTTSTTWGVVSLDQLKIGMNIQVASSGTQKAYEPVSGQTVITSNTATEIRGTFSGVVKNKQTNALASIYNGKFRAKKR
ncbi:MAG: carboxypeptidase-like regulatory domain-containing protein [Raineya sp.]|nr:carboxypeptidase-like regulatory domain-containing protein [Raineya sp.]